MIIHWKRLFITCTIITYIICTTYVFSNLELCMIETSTSGTGTSIAIGFGMSVLFHMCIALILGCLVLILYELRLFFQFIFEFKPKRFQELYIPSHFIKEISQQSTNFKYNSSCNWCGANDYLNNRCTTCGAPQPTRLGIDM